MTKRQFDTQPHYLIIGLGKTGYSVLKFLVCRGDQVTVCDTREAPPYLEKARAEFPLVDYRLGIDPQSIVADFDYVVVSPGIALDLPAAALGDVELFARENTVPCIAITGSNGKSTVTTLVAELLNAAGVNAYAGGNIGTPVLDLLAHQDAEAYVLELSSFQLESLSSLQPKAATVLNLSADHMDRYESIDDYAAAKLRILMGAETIVINRQDQRFIGAEYFAAKSLISFGLDRPESSVDFGLLKQNEQWYLAEGTRHLIAMRSLKLKGKHNVANVLAALSLVAAAGYPITEAMCQAAIDFKGLEHRGEFVLQHNDIVWVNDSKGTNAGASIAAIKGFDAPLVLLAGGQAKGADMSAFGRAMTGRVTDVVLFGQDADCIAEVVPEAIAMHRVDDLKQAVIKAQSVAKAGSTVLFSPACASFDMFDSFEQRGHLFKQYVNDLIGVNGNGGSNG